MARQQLQLGNTNVAAARRRRLYYVELGIASAEAITVRLFGRLVKEAGLLSLLGDSLLELQVALILLKVGVQVLANQRLLVVRSRSCVDYLRARDLGLAAIAALVQIIFPVAHVVHGSEAHDVNFLVLVAVVRLVEFVELVRSQRNDHVVRLRNNKLPLQIQLILLVVIAALRYVAS